jgi:SPP1 family predicted phage head-tail adaptor
VKPGALDQRVLLQRRIETRSLRGAAVVSYVDAGYLWARVEPLSGRELYNAQQTQAEITTRIRVHWQRGITELMRIVHTRSYKAPQLLDIYDIASVLDIDSQHNEMHLLCIKRASEQGISIPPSIITADMDSITADNG